MINVLKFWWEEKKVSLLTLNNSIDVDLFFTSVLNSIGTLSSRLQNYLEEIVLGLADVLSEQSVSRTVSL